MAVPQTLIQANKVITLAADVFFVDKTAFLLTVARRIKFMTTEHVPVRTTMSLSKHLKRVLEVYGRDRFVVRTILMKGEVEKIKSIMPSVECNTTAANGTCERGGAKNMDSEGKGLRAIGDATLQSHSKENED